MAPTQHEMRFTRPSPRARLGVHMERAKPLTREGLKKSVKGERQRRASAVPKAGVAIITCMDARIDPHTPLGLKKGDAHVIRNAGATVTPDVLRSLAVSQQLLATRRIVIMGHTDCGMTKTTEPELAQALLAGTGSRPPFEFDLFQSVEAHVADQVERVRSTAYLRRGDVSGVVLDVESGDVSHVVSRNPEVQELG